MDAQKYILQNFRRRNDKIPNERRILHTCKLM